MDTKNKRLGILEIAVLIGLGISVFALVLFLAGGPGHRMGLWGFRTGLTLVRTSAMIAMAALVVLSGSLVGMLALKHRKPLYPALLGLLVSGAIFAFLINMKRTAETVPRIHDITTDTTNPPAFVAVVPLRGAETNPVEYQGQGVADQQKAAYPDIQPLQTSKSADVAFEKALAAAKSLGWEIVASDPRTGTIEATDTTFWFGFKDDVVVRVNREGEGSRVDVRSKSRVGLSDLGANAARIRKFLNRLGSEL